MLELEPILDDLVDLKKIYQVWLVVLYDIYIEESIMLL